jgi:hypothetical protein
LEFAPISICAHAADGPFDKGNDRVNVDQLFKAMNVISGC